MYLTEYWNDDDDDEEEIVVLPPQSEPLKIIVDFEKDQKLNKQSETAAN